MVNSPFSITKHINVAHKAHNDTYSNVYANEAEVGGMIPNRFEMNC